MRRDSDDHLSTSSVSLDLVPSKSSPPPIPSGRGLSTANISGSTAFDHRDEGVIERNAATAKEEIDTPSNSHFEVLQNSFQSSLTREPTGSMENKDSSLDDNPGEPNVACSSGE